MAFPAKIWVLNCSFWFVAMFSLCCLSRTLSPRLPIHLSSVIFHGLNLSSHNVYYWNCMWQSFWKHLISHIMLFTWIICKNFKQSRKTRREMWNKIAIVDTIFLRSFEFPHLDALYYKNGVVWLCYTRCCLVTSNLIYLSVKSCENV